MNEFVNIISCSVHYRFAVVQETFPYVIHLSFLFDVIVVLCNARISSLSTSLAFSFSPARFLQVFRISLFIFVVRLFKNSTHDIF